MFTKFIKKFGWALGCILAIAVFVAVAGVSWIATCGLVYLVTLCFSLEFSWGVATGIWIILILVKDIFNRTVTVKK